MALTGVHGISLPIKIKCLENYIDKDKDLTDFVSGAIYRLMIRGGNAKL